MHRLCRFTFKIGLYSGCYNLPLRPPAGVDLMAGAQTKASYMSDPIKHECGLAFIRLRKPFSYYHQRYGTVMWGLNKLYLLMEKQHNRGQDGAGVAAVKLNVEPGYPFMQRIRSNAPQAIADIFQQIGNEVEDLEQYHPNIRNHPGLMKGHVKFLGELLLTGL